MQFIGVEPAPNMLRRAVERTNGWPEVQIYEGSFERLPLESASVDYLYSIHAFHWTTDVTRSIQELARVLKPAGEMDLFFIGRDNGHEFIRKTTPIFLKYMGPTLLLKSASLRKQLTKGAARQHFEQEFDHRRLLVEESYETYYDSIEGHWSWWVRIEGHFVQIPAHKKAACDQEVKQSLLELESEAGIPYTIHLLHVKLGPA
jgi:ubiquinone/menaquinone biosynthesis C-methylase UbiE